MPEIIQGRLQQYPNEEFPKVQTGFRKGCGNRDQISNSHCVLGKATKFQKNMHFFIDYA